MTGQGAGGVKPRPVLYTPELLSLAVSLAATPFDPAMPFMGEARSRTCGSTLVMSLETDAAGAISRVGLRAAACAIGQSAAALFVAGAQGLSRADIAATFDDLSAWLAGSGPIPRWPGLEVLRPALEHPGRHGAILLAWEAALAALSNSEAPR